MAEIRNQLTLLATMSKPKLLVLWKQVSRITPPRQVRRDLLIRLLAYRIQEQAYGGLSAETGKRLNELARKFNSNPDTDVSGVPRIKPGTRLIRDWRGQSHRVTVLEKGYQYSGKRYPSLSQIARLITGTRWSGPLFFGLRGNHGKEELSGH